MKTTIKVTELSHEELVNILSSATYSNELLQICVADNSEELADALRADAEINTSCREDVWAEVLLHGGNIYIIDTESGAKNEEDAKKHAYKGKAHDVGYIELNGWWGPFGATYYEINIKDFLKGCSKPKAYEYLSILVDDDGDMWDGYNLIQLIAYGKEIYG